MIDHYSIEQIFSLALFWAIVFGIALGGLLAALRDYWQK